MKNIILMIITAAWFSACSSEQTPDTAQAQTAATPEKKVLQISKQQMEKSGIALGIPEQRNIAASLTVNGAIAVAADNKATVSSKIAGRIEQFFVREGQNVRKGQALLSISSSLLFDIQQAYLQSKADLLFLEKELERQKILSSQNVGALKNYEEAQSKYARAKGDMQTAAAKLQFLGVNIAQLNNTDQLDLAKTVIVTAPISGNITLISSNLGASVGEGAALCTLVGTDDLYAHIEVFSKDIAFVKQGQPVKIQFPNSTLTPVDAKINYISLDMHPESKTYSIHVELPANKAGNWLPGMPVMAEIRLPESAQAGTLALPEAAVLQDGTTYYCFVATHSGGDMVTFDKIAFEPAGRGGGYIGVPAGLLEGKNIVLKGANLVDGEMHKGDME